MASDDSAAHGSGHSPPEEDLTVFLGLLNELKATGCTLLVVGDESREVFTRASGRLLGDGDLLRQRVLAVTDASSRSIADRLPEPDSTPRPLAETTTVVNHAGEPRSVTAATDPDTAPELAGIEERCVCDPNLQGLQSALTDGIVDAANRVNTLHSADLRVGIDSLDPLVSHYGVDVVKRCLDAVGERVCDHDGMSHYVLREPYDSDTVQTLVPTVDAVVELRTVDTPGDGRDAQQRWHVPRRDIRTEWTPL